MRTANPTDRPRHVNEALNVHGVAPTGGVSRRLTGRTIGYAYCRPARVQGFVQQPDIGLGLRTGRGHGGARIPIGEDSTCNDDHGNTDKQLQTSAADHCCHQKLEPVPQPLHEIHPLMEHGDHDDAVAFLNKEDVVMAAMVRLHLVDR